MAQSIDNSDWIESERWCEDGFAGSRATSGSLPHYFSDDYYIKSLPRGWQLFKRVGSRAKLDWSPDATFSMPDGENLGFCGMDEGATTFMALGSSGNVVYIYERELMGSEGAPTAHVTRSGPGDTWNACERSGDMIIITNYWHPNSALSIFVKQRNGEWQLERRFRPNDSEYTLGYYLKAFGSMLMVGPDWAPNSYLLRNDGGTPSGWNVYKRLHSQRGGSGITQSYSTSFYKSAASVSQSCGANGKGTLTGAIFLYEEEKEWKDPVILALEEGHRGDNFQGTGLREDRLLARSTGYCDRHSGTGRKKKPIIYVYDRVRRGEWVQTLAYSPPGSREGDWASGTLVDANHIIVTQNFMYEDAWSHGCDGRYKRQNGTVCHTLLVSATLPHRVSVTVETVCGSIVGGDPLGTATFTLPDTAPSALNLTLVREIDYLHPSAGASDAVVHFRNGDVVHGTVDLSDLRLKTKEFGTIHLPDPKHLLRLIT